MRKLRNDHPHLVHLAGRCEAEGPQAFRGVLGVVDALSRYLATQDASSVATLLPPDDLYEACRVMARPAQSSFSVWRISAGARQLLVGPASSSFSEQMNVRSSTRATSVGSDQAR